MLQAEHGEFELCCAKDFDHFIQLDIVESVVPLHTSLTWLW